MCPCSVRVLFKLWLTYLNQRWLRPLVLCVCDWPSPSSSNVTWKSNFTSLLVSSYDKSPLVQIKISKCGPEIHFSTIKILTDFRLDQFCASIHFWIVSTCVLLFSLNCRPFNLQIKRFLSLQAKEGPLIQPSATGDCLMMRSFWLLHVFVAWNFTATLLTWRRHFGGGGRWERGQSRFGLGWEVGVYYKPTTSENIVYEISGICSNLNILNTVYLKI